MTTQQVPLVSSTSLKYLKMGHSNLFFVQFCLLQTNITIFDNILQIVRYRTIKCSLMSAIYLFTSIHKRPKNQVFKTKVTKKLIDQFNFWPFLNLHSEFTDKSLKTSRDNLSDRQYWFMHLEGAVTEAQVLIPPKPFLTSSSFCSHGPVKLNSDCTIEAAASLYTLIKGGTNNGERH